MGILSSVVDDEVQMDIRMSRDSMVRPDLKYLPQRTRGGAYASSGAEIHILITDIQMPGMTGLEFAKRQRRSGGDHVILLSRYSSLVCKQSISVWWNICCLEAY